MVNILLLMEELAEAETQLDAATLELKDKRAVAQSALDAIDKEIEDSYPVLRKNISVLREAILTATGKLGHTFRGPIYTVKYRKGYTQASYDAKKLDGYAAAHPEILTFRKDAC